MTARLGEKVRAPATSLGAVMLGLALAASPASAQDSSVSDPGVGEDAEIVVTGERIGAGNLRAAADACSSSCCSSSSPVAPRR